MHLIYVEDNDFDILAFSRLMKKFERELSFETHSGFQVDEENLRSGVLIRDCYLNSDDENEGIYPFTFYVSGSSYSSVLERKFNIDENCFFQKPLSQENIRYIQKHIDEQLPDRTPNLEYVEELSEGDTKFEDKMIHTYLMEVPENISELRAAFKKRNYPLTSQILHNIRTKIRVFGLLEIDELTERLEVKFAELPENAPINEYGVLLGRLVMSLTDSVQKLGELKNEMHNN